MPSKKYTDLLDFSVEDLSSELKARHEQLQQIEFEHAVRGLENPMKLRELRRDIARLNTEIRRRELKNESA